MKAILKIVVSLIFLIIGMLYATIPFSIQLLPMLPTFGFEELMLQFAGVILLIIGIAIALMH